MSENVQEIIDELIQKYEEGELTLQDIDEAVERCSLIDPKATDNAVTVLYSGGEDAIAESLAASKMNIRIINRTEAYDLLTYNKNGRSFNEFVRQAVNNENPGLYGDALKEAVNQKLYGTSKPGSGVSEVGEGYWSKISSQFASETKGDVYALVTDARADRIFRLEELKQALNVMADNKTINGCSKAELGKLSIDKIFETVKGKAIEDFADETVYVNERGQKIGETLTNKFLREIFGQNEIKPTDTENYIEISYSDYLEAMHNKTTIVDKNGKYLGTDYKGTVLEGFAKDDVFDPAQDIIRIKNSDYVEVEVKGGSGAVRNALRNSEIFIDEQGNIVGRSYKGTALEGHVSDVIPEDYVYSTTQGHFDAYASDAEMLARHGEVYENAQGAKRWIAKEWDYLQRVAQGEIVGDAYAESILRYAGTTGKKLGELGKLDRIIINVSDFIYNSTAVKIANKFLTSKVGSFVMRGMEVTGVVVMAAVCTYEVCDMIVKVNDAIEKGDYGIAAGIASGKTAKLLTTFLGGAEMANMMAPEFIAIGSMFAGPVGALLGGMVAYGVGFLLGEACGVLFDDALEYVGKGWNMLYDEAMSLIRYVADPLVLDLDGDGFETLSVNDGVYFDEDATGLAEKTAWVSADDALLAVDLNGNGVIDDGSELLGTSTLLANGEKAKSGFEALAQYDTNGDGVIDCNDEIFSKILIWQDKNGDGVSQKDELISLEKAGIVSISLETSVEDGRRVVIVTYADGSTRKLGEFDFEAQYYNTVEKDNIEISEEIQALPDVRAMGNVASLHSLMQMDATGTLKDYVQRFAKAASREEKEALVTDMLYFITGATGVAEHSRGGQMDARKLMVVEKFMGRNFVGTQGENPVNTAAPVLNQIYNEIFQMYYCLLNSQTQLADYMNLLCVTEDENGTKTVHMEMFYAFIDACRQSGADMSDIVGEMGRYIRFIDKSNSDDFQNYLQHYIADEKYLRSIAQASFLNAFFGTDGNDSYSASSSAALFGNDGNDTLQGSAENDVIYGGAGNDRIYGGNGDDILYGGTGDDRLEGGMGNDTYYFDLGDGNDVINDYESSSTEGRDDKIIFGEGIRPEDVQMERIGDDLVIRYSDNDSITVHNAYYYSDGRYQIESIVFADGTVWKDEEIGKRCNTRHGSDGDDEMYGYDRMLEYDPNETFYAGDGNDVVDAGNGNDIIYGGAGNDRIYGGNGDDILYGGTGDDRLEGGMGSDTYYFDLGDGKDVINDYESSSTEGRDDKIIFGEGIRPEDVQMERIGDDLVIRYSENDSITVHNAYYYSDGRYQIESIVFADGTVWKDEEIGKRCNTRHGSDGDDEMYGYDRMLEYDPNETFYGGAGNDRIYGGNGDDILYGGTGDDRLEGGMGNDTYYFDLGDGKDVINDYESSSTEGRDDKIIFGEGIRPEDVQMERIGDDLVIRYSDNDSITVHNAYYYSDGRYQIESIVFADGTVWKDEEIGKRCNTRHGSDGDDEMYGYDRMLEYDPNETFYAGDGNDRIYGGNGDDILYGGTGDDRLEGGMGNDTYYFDLGDGKDVINDYESSSTEGRDDKIIFGEGIRPEDVQMERIGDDLVIRYSENDSITVHNAYYYSDGRYQIESIVFADGTVWKDEEIGKRCNTRHGSDGDDEMYGYDRMLEYDPNETFYAGDGNDVVDAGNGNDIIYGGAGNDRIYGGNGDDILYGGTGDDRLEGGMGNDTYYFDLGDGKDVINDYESSSTEGRDDKIIFGEGIRPEDVQMERIGDDLAIRYSDNDSITVHNAYYYSDGRYQIEKMQFQDESVYNIDYTNTKLEPEILNNEIAEESAAQVMCEDISQEYVCVENSPEEGILVDDNMEMLASEMANLAIQEMSETTMGNVADTFNMANNTGNETDVQLWIEK